MEVRDRIKAILDHYNLSVSEFVTQTGVKTGQAVYDLLSGKTKSISSSMEDKILSCFQDLDKIWLLTGEGEMLKPSQVIHGDGNVQVAGNAHNVNAGSTIDAALGEIAKAHELLARRDEQLAKRDEQLARRDEQMDRLLAVIEKLTDREK